MSYKQYQRLTATNQPSPPANVGVSGIRHPVQVGGQRKLKEVVINLLEEDTPENTKKTIGSLMEEYVEYCRTVYSIVENSNILHPDRIYHFMYYQTFREQKGRGGSRKSKQDRPKFDEAEYNTLIDNYKQVGIDILRFDR
mmetsp:Transcript_5642/g.13663  ORF Transcript_5642/g.13663 Transcript_5642/m.13663 type:complete len:140 (-) Transcript_5642:612-1031(-)